MLHKIKKVEYLEDYKLKLTFNDKKKKIVDLKINLNQTLVFLLCLPQNLELQH